MRNTDHTSSQDETKAEAEAEEKEEVKADIKSNNPHLTGGEKQMQFQIDLKKTYAKTNI